MRALILILLLVAPLAGEAQRAAALPDFKALMKDQGPAVVNILSVLRRQPHAAAGAGAPTPGEGVGSGFIISEDGYILTNAHLVADAVDVTVRLADAKREFHAAVVGADKRSDVALLKVDARGLPTARLGSSQRLEPGDWVAAIGSPFGFANTITAGIVSAKDRALPEELYVPFIQTDVAVNPGNSGGPLIDLHGEVVGVNSLIYSGTGGYMGVSFAIPIEEALKVSRELKRSGKVRRGWAGIGVQALTPELARSFRVGAENGGVIVNVEKGGPAERAGARVGDVILEWNGTRIDDPAAMPRLVAATAPGSVASLTVSRAGAPRRLELEVDELPREAARTEVAAARAEPGTLGMSLHELTPAERKRLGVDYGLLVRAVSGPPAAASGLRVGDVIIGVGEQRIDSREALAALLSARGKGEVAPLLVRRGESLLFVPLTVARAG
ncbi:MAG TPA: trypsin-like peptidase domain-containing protein [Burkholderiales bacterium]|nr:trypsin-like peptidase domain-containing protein [Burkholderiales bacterium]